MIELTDKDTYTYVTVKWSTYDNTLEIPHVEHFNVNLTLKEFIDRVVTYYKDKIMYLDCTLTDTHQWSSLISSESKSW